VLNKPGHASRIVALMEIKRTRLRSMPSGRPYLISHQMAANQGLVQT
jgi:hypothetical protein